MGKRNWRVARVQECVFKHSESGRGPYITIRFSLLEHYRFQDKRVRKVFASFSSLPQSWWKMVEFLQAIEATELETLPNKVILGRYCKVYIVEEEYKNTTHLHVVHFEVLNPHIETKAEIEEERKAVERETARED